MKKRKRNRGSKSPVYRISNLSLRVLSVILAIIVIATYVSPLSAIAEEESEEDAVAAVQDETVFSDDPGSEEEKEEETEEIAELDGDENVEAEADPANQAEMQQVTEEMCTLTFDGNGGTCTIAPITVKKGDVANIPFSDSTQCSRDGYIFLGWGLQSGEKTEGETIYTSGKTFFLNENIILYAKWSELLKTAEQIENEWLSKPRTLPEFMANESLPLPAKYDPRDYGMVTAVKNQGANGLCYIYGCLSTIESSLLRRGLITSKDNISINYVYYYSWKYDYPKTQDYNPSESFESYAGRYLRNNDLEKYILFNIKYMALANASENPLEPISQETLASYAPPEKDKYDFTISLEYSLPDSKKNINGYKEAIRNYGAIDTSIYYNDYRNQNLKTNINDRHDSSWSSNETGADIESHEISIVGWDDEYPIDGFTVPVPGKGAWLIKNSYRGAGNSSYIWVSYYSKDIYKKATVYDTDQNRPFKVEPSVFTKAFVFNKDSSIITIPDTVTVMGNTFQIKRVEGSLEGNKNIQKLEIGNNCDDFDVNCSGSTVKEVVLGKGCRAVGKGAFKNCKHLSSITMPYNGSSYNRAVIYTSAFEGCSKLNKVALPTYTNIEDSAFKNCSSLVKILGAKNICEIGNSAFEGCKKLKEITLGVSSKKVKSGRYIKVGKNAFKGCKGLKKLTIYTSKDDDEYEKTSFKGISAKTKLILKGYASKKKANKNKYLIKLKKAGLKH